jgi:hypothetical protein
MGSEDDRQTLTQRKKVQKKLEARKIQMIQEPSLNGGV